MQFRPHYPHTIKNGIQRPPSIRYSTYNFSFSYPLTEQDGVAKTVGQLILYEWMVKWWEDNVGRTHRHI